MSHVPAIRGIEKILSMRMMQSFDGSESPSRKLFNEKPIPPDWQIKDMVLIDFRHVPFMKNFRWDKQWWGKTRWCGAINQVTFQGAEFAENQKVGVRLRDLHSAARQWIHKKTTSDS